MRILDRYITQSIIKTFTITILTFCFLYILIDITSQLDEFIDRKVPVDILIQYYMSYFPIILSQPISSVACLIAVLFTFSSLNTTNEVVAMRSSGLNFWQITKPAVVFGLIISILVFWVNERLVPHATEVTEQIRNENMVLLVDRMRKKKEKFKNLTLYGLNNRLYFIDTFDSEANELKGVTIIEHDSGQNMKQKIVALKGVWTGIAWKFYQCQITTFDQDDITTPLKIKVYKEKLMDIKESPDDFLKQRLNVNSMNIRQLRDYIERFSKSGAQKALNNMQVDLHQKIAYPFGNFVIVLIGLPFALMIRSHKGSTFIAIGMALVLGFLYYVANAVSLAFGKSSLLSPVLSAWMTPILFTLIALVIIETDFAN
ncbi:MAG: LptF/LptG family permease [Candidatus Omnitrophica bacterium]|nr:LptF/LptG family permease [Candidatus Omnitrophota bacterium]